MVRFWLLKSVRTLITLLFVVTFTFVVLRTSGDPVQSLLGPDATNEEIAQFRSEWGLDRSLAEQYILYAGNVARGEFGKSYRDGRPVLDIVLEPVPATLLLGLTAYALSVLLGVPAGIIAALRRNSIINRAIMGFAVMGFALPNLFLGILLILLFSLYLQWLPSSGIGTVAHLVMPALTLGLFSAGTIARFTRSAMLETLSKLYMRAAAAKGYLEGFAQIYTDVAEQIAARLERREPNPLSQQAPTVAHGVRCIEAAVKSSQKKAAWTALQTQRANGAIRQALLCSLPWIMVTSPAQELTCHERFAHKAGLLCRR
ncbi:MAG TPA: ABC transporter permease [Microvirga sp.]|jgi:ABC-type dipeptide/oligopeptide/nickel transport system permease component|nr:ABC transporter permease [Microvirga sp.]